MKGVSSLTLLGQTGSQIKIRSEIAKGCDKMITYEAEREEQAKSVDVKR